MSERVTLTAKISKRMRDLRTTAGLSQYELAERTGLTRPKIKRIEKREITTVSEEDLAAIEQELGGAPKRRKRSTKSNGKTNGVRKPRKARVSTSGRTKVTPAPADPVLDTSMQDEVNRRLRESVLTVMRDLIGDSGRVLVEKHNLHDVTLAELYAVDV